MSETLTARVISQYNELYKVSLEGADLLAEVSGKYRHATSRLEDYPAVGDYVKLRKESSDTDRLIIEEVLPRKSVFKRMAVSSGDQSQVIAANVDILFVCMALNEDYSINRLERYLSAAWESGSTPVIILTKADLAENLEASVSEVSSIAFGVDVLITSLDDESSFAAVARYIDEETTASFVGSSGIGKSTIVNHLLGYDAIATADTRQDGKGRHTTTRRELFVLDNGGAIIDTPGMREFGLDSANLTKSFSDIESLAQQCKFGDCTHESEPGCAIKQALEESRLDERRMASYQKLKKELGYEGLSSRQIEEMKIKTMVGSFNEMKAVRNHVKKKNAR